MGTLRKNQKELLEIKKKTAKEMKNAFDGLICRLDWTQPRKESASWKMCQ